MDLKDHIRGIPDFPKPGILFYDISTLLRDADAWQVAMGRLARVVRAYQNFKDEPGFTRVVPIEEIRAKEGNLSIPLYVGGETQAQADAATVTATTALPDALAAWLKSSKSVRASLETLLQTR